MDTTAGIIILIGRILFVIFPAYISGYRFHWKQQEGAKGYAASANFPSPLLAAWPSAVWLIASSISIAVGIFPDVGALMMALFVAIAAVYFHRYWELEGGQRAVQESFFYRNVIMFGTALVMFGFFAGVGDALRFTVTGPLFDLTP